MSWIFDGRQLRIANEHRSPVSCLCWLTTSLTVVLFSSSLSLTFSVTRHSSPLLLLAIFGKLLYDSAVIDNSELCQQIILKREESMRKYDELKRHQPATMWVNISSWPTAIFSLMYWDYTHPVDYCWNSPSASNSMTFYVGFYTVHCHLSG